MKQFRLIICILFAFHATTNVHAQKNNCYFYGGKNYGSESLIHPLSLILHGGYGIMQIENRPNTPLDVDYKTGFRNVWENVKNPLPAIRAYGWKDFVLSEIVPVSVDNTQANYWPNYTQHLIGGGMSYRMMVDWYRYHGFPQAKLFSVATIAVYHALNEVVENGSFRGYNVDPIADLYLFDPLSIVLFNFDAVAKFFANTMHMADWSYQLAFNPWDKTIQNNGQNFAMKLRIPNTSRWSLFYYYGTHGELGFSYARPNGDAISFGAGLTAKELVGVKGKDDSHLRSLTANLALTAGVFYDRNGSLLASLIYAGKKDNMIRLNIYPGMIRIGEFSPGFFLLINRQKEAIAGIQLWLLPFAIARNL